MKYRYRSLWVVLCAGLCACTPLTQGVKDSAQSLGEARDDIALSMRDLFTYHPAPKVPQPSVERYCYRFSSDIVCYGTPQPQLTARIVGVQGTEGARIIIMPDAVPTDMATALTVSPAAPVASAPISAQPLLPPPR